MQWKLVKVTKAAQNNKANAIVERPLTYNLYKKLKSPDGADIFIVTLPVVAVPIPTWAIKAIGSNRKKRMRFFIIKYFLIQFIIFIYTNT